MPKKRAKKDTLLRDFTIGVASSAFATLLILLVLGRQVTTLEKELEMIR